MKILFITPYIPSPTRPRPYNLIKGLSQRHEISLVCLYRPNEEYIDDIKRYCLDFHPILLKRCKSYFNCGLNILSGTPLQVHYFYSEQILDKIGEVLKNNGFDIVHLEMIRLAYLIPKLRDIPKAYDLVDSFSLYYKRCLGVTKNSFPWMLNLLEFLKMKRYEIRICAGLDKVLISSSVDKRALQESAPDLNIEVLPNGVDLDYFKSEGNKLQQDSIVFHGRMGYSANVQSVLWFYRRVFPLIKKEVPEIMFYIVGESPHRKIRNLASKNIIVTGYVEDIRPYLCKGTVAVYPLRLSAGIKNKILEAMALGKPVVTTSLGLEGLNAVPGRDLIVVDEPKEFAGNIIELLHRKKNRERLAENARRYVEENHKWETSVKKLEEIYVSLLGK